MFDILLKIIRQFALLGGVYFGWTLVHLISSNIYTMYCAELSIVGYFTSLLASTTPYCKGLLYLINTGHDITLLMWKTLGAWVLTNVIYKTAIQVRNNTINTPN